MPEETKANAAQQPQDGTDTQEPSHDEKFLEAAKTFAAFLKGQENEGEKAADTDEQPDVQPKDKTAKTATDTREAGKAQSEPSGGVAAPSHIQGEHPSTERGYSYGRLIKAQLTGDWSNAKVEREVGDQLQKLGYSNENLGTVVPINSRYLEEQHSELKGLGERLSKDLSEGTDSAGGHLVSVEQAAEIVDLLRANSVVEQAGAQVRTLPRSGQLDIPKLTADPTAYWVGENSSITESEPTFGNLQLRAKKLAALVPLSNEVIADSTPEIEGVVRQSIAQQMGLTADLAYLNGAGTTTEPQGIKNWGSIVDYTLVNDTGDGADIVYNDIVNIIDEVESNNGMFEAYIFHSKVRRKVRQIKDSNNLPIFVQNPNATPNNALFGFPTFISTQIPTNQTKGSGSNLTELYAGMFSRAVIARAATMSLRASDTASDAFHNDQTFIRGIMRVDFGLLTEDVFVYADGIKTT